MSTICLPPWDTLLPPSQGQRDKSRPVLTHRAITPPLLCSAAHDEPSADDFSRSITLGTISIQQVDVEQWLVVHSLSPPASLLMSLLLPKPVCLLLGDVVSCQLSEQKSPNLKVRSSDLSDSRTH
ncbi:unnamed protein product [Pleuronectes platessa]|uniref:Uncharacterized protein n=1 Tax=Pleuronectes platessa TaxID=8262 RepID=A0A9N7VG73_PLEPL|nr:unnamed protein product [Pleuronectes platessa]